MPLSIAINGFGRMGRSIFKEALRRGINVSALNDVAAWDVLLYLLEFDSAHGRYDCRYDVDGDSLRIEHQGRSQHIKLNSVSTVQNFDTNSAYLVIESSGKFLDSGTLLPYISNGAKRVVISANAHDDTKTLVFGVNHLSYAGEDIISNASCTTHCIAPICDTLEREFGIVSGMLTTIHSYTSNQSLLDSAHEHKRRSRSAPNNIVPTTTGAAIGLRKVLPSLDGKIHGQSVRVPVLDVSMANLDIYLSKDANLDSLKEAFVRRSRSDLSGILEIDSKQRVSSDFLGDPSSAIVPLDLMLKVGNMIKVMAWYDNEIGYANRILDTAEYIFRWDREHGII